MVVGDRCEVRIGGKWYPGTVSGVGLGPEKNLFAVDFDIQGAKCNVTEDKLRPIKKTPEAQLSMLGDA